MNQRKKRRIGLMIFATDAVSLNILCKGQLEYLRDKWQSQLFIVSGGTNEEIQKLRERSVGKVTHLPHLKRRPSPWHDLVSLIGLCRIMLRCRPQIVVVSTPKALFIGSVAAFICGIPNRIALIRGRVYERYSGNARKIYEVLDRISFALSTKQVFISESLRAEYVRDKLTSNETSIVIGAGSSNGVDVRHFRFPSNEEREQSRRKYGVTDNVFTIVSIGRLCEEKGVREFLRIAKDLGDKCRLLWVGRAEQIDILDAVAAASKQYRNVKYIDHCDDVRPVLWAADAHLFLSHREGFGNVAIEAASCGVPTIAFDIVGARDSVRHGISGVRIPFGNTSAIAETVMALRSGRTENIFNRTLARRWVEEAFDQRRVWEQWYLYLSNVSLETKNHYT